MIKTIFFDTSDTLYSNKTFEKSQAEQPIHLLAELKRISFQDARQLFNAKKTELANKLSHVTKVSVMIEFGVSRQEMQEHMAKLDAHNFLSADVDLTKILKSLSKKYKLGIISNILKKSVTNVLAALCVPLNLFSYFVTVDNTTKSKPDAEPFLKAIELANCSPEEIIYVGDSLTKDIIPAKNVGLKTIWITKEPTDDPHADFIIADLYKLPSVLAQI